MSVLWAHTRRILVAMMLLIAVPASLVAIVPDAAADVRHALHFALRPDPGSVAQAAGYFRANASTATAIALLALMLAFLRPATGARRLTVAAGDGALTIALAPQIALIGLTLGAYGLQAVPWLPHLPIELAGVALSLALYLTARAGQRLPGRCWAATFAASLTLLAGAALIESYLTPGGPLT